jgi:hypothetical protein
LRYVLSFLCCDQIAIRATVLTGACLYLVYYHLIEIGPMWDAMTGSMLIGTANLIGLIGLIYSRMSLGMPEHQRSIFEALGALVPGVFWALTRIALHKAFAGDDLLTREGETPDSLCFVMSGRLRIAKYARRFDIDGGCFIGEMSWMPDAPASAAVTLPAGARHIVWPRDKLDRPSRRSPRSPPALEAMIAQDMARKVAPGRRRPVTDIAVLEARSA